jgi:hypothetical protein
VKVPERAVLIGCGVLLAAGNRIGALVAIAGVTAVMVFARRFRVS